MAELKWKGCIYMVTSGSGDLPGLLLIFLVFFRMNRMADMSQARQVRITYPLQAVVLGSRQRFTWEGSRTTKQIPVPPTSHRSDNKVLLQYWAQRGVKGPRHGGQLCKTPPAWEQQCSDKLFTNGMVTDLPEVSVPQQTYHVAPF